MSTPPSHLQSEATRKDIFPWREFYEEDQPPQSTSLQVRGADGGHEDPVMLAMQHTWPRANQKAYSWEGQSWVSWTRLE